MKKFACFGVMSQVHKRGYERGGRCLRGRACLWKWPHRGKITYLLPISHFVYTKPLIIGCYIKKKKKRWKGFKKSVPLPPLSFYEKNLKAV